MYGEDAHYSPYHQAMEEHLVDQLGFCADELRVPLAHFSTEPVEKKNHDHSRFFFLHTQMGGGKGGSNAAEQIMQKENRSLFININCSIQEEVFLF